MTYPITDSRNPMEQPRQTAIIADGMGQTTAMMAMP